MKKFIKIILFTFLIILPVKAFGACTVDDKVRYLTLASNITTSYDYTEANNKVTFSITIHNVHKDLVVKDNVNNKNIKFFQVINRKEIRFTQHLR